jgi:hypothetical protein
MSVKERLKRLAKIKEKSVSTFEKRVGLSNGYINAIRVSIQPDKIESIASNYPDVNIEWLLTGEGPMIKESMNHTNQNTDNKMEDLKMMDYLISEVNYLRKKLDTQEDERKQLRLLAEKLIDENRTLMSLVTNTSEPKKKEAI